MVFVQLTLLDFSTFFFFFLGQGLRPDLPSDAHPKLLELMQKCWDSTPCSRPSFSDVRAELEHLQEEVEASFLPPFAQVLIDVFVWTSVQFIISGKVRRCKLSLNIYRNHSHRLIFKHSDEDLFTYFPFRLLPSRLGLPHNYRGYMY